LPFGLPRQQSFEKQVLPLSDWRRTTIMTALAEFNLGNAV
jgi:hypothetical protein